VVLVEQNIDIFEGFYVLQFQGVIKMTDTTFIKQKLQNGYKEHRNSLKRLLLVHPTSMKLWMLDRYLSFSSTENKLYFSRNGSSPFQFSIKKSPSFLKFPTGCTACLNIIFSTSGIGTPTQISHKHSASDCELNKQLKFHQNAVSKPDIDLKTINVI